MALDSLDNIHNCKLDKADKEDNKGFGYCKFRSTTFEQVVMRQNSLVALDKRDTGWSSRWMDSFSNF